jgi:hypothetical protein
MLRCSSKDGTEKIYTYREETMKHETQDLQGTMTCATYPKQVEAARAKFNQSAE